MQRQLIALAEAKELLSITGTASDAKIMIYMPIIENYVKTYCNSNFDGGFPEGLKLVFVDMVKYRLAQATADPSLKTEKIGNITRQFSDVYPAQIDQALDAFKQVRFI